MLGGFYLCTHCTSPLSHSSIILYLGAHICTIKLRDHIMIGDVWANSEIEEGGSWEQHVAQRAKCLLSPSKERKSGGPL
jgi:hypothetical protein